MKLILQITAGVLLAKLIWLMGEMIVANAAMEAFEQSLKSASHISPTKTQPNSVKQVVVPTAPPPAPIAPAAPKLPTYPFPSNTVPAGNFACMNGITLRKEASGWTQLGGSTQSPTCVTP
jgi:hypothetical protein